MEEKILVEGLCNRVKSALFVQNGHGVLTNKRFIYSKHSFSKLMVMGVLSNLTKGDYEFDISISDIKCVSRGKQGISNNVIVIETKSEDTYKFVVTKYMEWEIAFKNLLEAHEDDTGAKLTDEPEVKIQFCTDCGNTIVGDAKFCSQCGKKL